MTIQCIVCTSCVKYRRNTMVIYGLHITTASDVDFSTIFICEFYSSHCSEVLEAVYTVNNIHYSINHVYSEWCDNGVSTIIIMLFPLHDVNTDDVSPLFTDLPSLAPGGAWRVSLEGDLLSLVEGGATCPPSRPWEDVVVEWIQATVLPHPTDWVWSVATTPRPSPPRVLLSRRKTLLNLLQGWICQGDEWRLAIATLKTKWQ